MAGRRRVTVEQWIETALGDTDKQSPCTALTLVHIKSGGGQEEIHGKSLDGAVPNAKQLGAFFLDRAQTFAQDLPGMQYFKMLAFYGREEPQATFPFTLNDGELTGGDNGYARHEATPTGLLGQMMKHNEVVMGTLTDLVRGLAAESWKREQGLRAEVFEAHVVVKDVILNMRKESHEMRMKELEFSRSSSERQLLAKFLPSVVNQFSGREVIPEAHADTELIEALASTVKPEQIAQLGQLGIIPAPVAALLTARFAKVAEQRLASQRALQMIPSETTAEDSENAAAE